MRAEKKDRAEALSAGRKGDGTRRKLRGRRSEKKEERESAKKKEKGSFRQEGGTVEGVEKSTRRIREGAHEVTDTLLATLCSQARAMKYSDEMPS